MAGSATATGSTTGPTPGSTNVGTFVYSRKRDEPGLEAIDLDDPRGANAGDSDMVLAHLISRPPEVRAGTLVLVNCGLHDIKRRPAGSSRRPGGANTSDDRSGTTVKVPLDRYQSNLEAITELLAQSRARLVWLTTTPVIDEVHARAAPGFERFAADLARYNEVATSVMAAAGVAVIDLHGFTMRLGAGDMAGLYCDHVHFTKPVRQAQAAFIAGFLTGLDAARDEHSHSGPA